MSVMAALERAEGFTETERRLAAYLLEHADEVSSLSIAELAQATYTSNASIVRLCRKVGVRGYRELRVKLASELERRRVELADVDASYPFDASDSTPEMLAHMASLTKDAVDQCYAALDAAAVEQVARLVRDAGLVCIFAVGDSQISAEALENMLVKIGVHCVVAGRYGDSEAVARSMRSGDVALFVSYRGSTFDSPVYQGILQIVKGRGCTCVLVSSMARPAWADCALTFPPRERAQGKMATFYSQVCIRYILNCLYAAVYALDFSRNAAALDEFF